VTPEAALVSVTMRLCGLWSQDDIERLRAQIQREKEQWERFVAHREASLEAITELETV
jgi:hypothetical protein